MDLRIHAVWTEDDEAQRIAMIINNEKKAFEQEMRSQQHSKYLAKTVSRFEDRRDAVQNWRNEPEEVFDDSWCYYCASPIKHLSNDMRKTVRQFLHVRRTTYPHEVATEECNNAKNLSLLRRQKCRHGYCATIVLVDHDEGASFVLRGCAENFGAIDTKFLEKQEDNSCLKLHDVLDIKECICKTKSYCYAGHGRRRSASLYCGVWAMIVVGCVIALFRVV